MDLCLIQTCSICHCSLLEDEELGSMGGLAIATKCGHLFHKSCLATWFSTAASPMCPMCRAPGKSLTAVKLDIEPPPGDGNVSAALTKKVSELQSQTRDLSQTISSQERDLQDKTVCLEVDTLAQSLVRVQTQLETRSSELKRATALLKQQNRKIKSFNQLLETETANVDSLYKSLQQLDSEGQEDLCKAFCSNLNKTKEENATKSLLLRQKQNEIDRLKALLLDSQVEAENRQMGPLLDTERPRKRLKPLFSTHTTTCD